MKRTATLCIAVLLSLSGIVTAAEAAGYAIVVSKKTQADAEWARVVEALRAKHGGTVIAYDKAVEEALPALRQQFPCYACFVATPAEAGRGFVAAVHGLTRKLDDDPYADCFWGILTGYDAAAALRIANCRDPLVVRKVASGTDVAMEMCEEGVWYCELQKNRMVRKEKGGQPTQLKGPDDTTEALARTLTDYKADLFITSGHATERDWQIGFRYRNGSFRCENGVLYGLDTQNRRFPIQSPNPKVYLPIGNCLMGHIDGRDAMALAFMNSAGVNQMIGYTVPTWYGYAGWGCLDYFVEQPARYTFTEAFFANQAALIHRMGTYFPENQLTEQARAAGLTANDAKGLSFDRDVVAFYGDPAWEARMAPGPCAWEQSLRAEGDTWVLEIKPARGEMTFAPINTNGSQRGGRPIVQFLRRRIGDAQVTEGADLKPLITDNFILIPNPGKCDLARTYRVSFRAKAL